MTTAPANRTKSDLAAALPIDGIKLVAIGASTGAPELVRQILINLPADLRVPIFIAQHMPPAFTESMALSIARESPLAVHHAENGMPVLPGVVYIGQGHRHMSVWKGATGRPTIRIAKEPEHKLYRPSADVLFASANEVRPGRVLAIVMSGIGTDGLEAAHHVRHSGGLVVTQSADTCAVYGMPRACDEAGLSNASLSPENIRRLLARFSAASA
ncbi:MAG: CheB methylesterase domain-containing protein [Phycisphaeraceae bacterium]